MNNDVLMKRILANTDQLEDSTRVKMLETLLEKKEGNQGWQARITFCEPDDGYNVFVKVKPDGTREVSLYILSGFFGDGICELADTLYQLTKDDKVTLYIDSPGGSVANMCVLLLAMQECECPIHGVVRQQASSCGAFTLAHCDTFSVNDLSEVMFHSMAGMRWGKLKDIEDGLKVLNTWNRTLSEAAISKGLLTEKEYSAMMDHKRDLFMFGRGLKAKIANAKGGIV